MKRLTIMMLSAALWAQTAPPAAKPAAAKPKPAAAKAKPAAPPKTAAAPAVPEKPAAPVKADDPVVFAIGDFSLTAQQFEQYVANLPENLRAEARQPGGKLRLAQRLLDIKSYAWEARQRKLDGTPQAQALMALQAENVLASLLYQDVLKAVKPDGVAVEKYYREHEKEFVSARARHILIRFKGSPVPLKANQTDLSEADALAKAQALRKKLIDGEDFAALAKAESDDAGSGANGGSLGRFSKGQMVPPFEEAVFKQAIGDVGEPVKTQFGWHVIQVEERGSTPLNEMRANIEQRLQPQAAQQAMEELKQRVPTKFDTQYFGK